MAKYKIVRMPAGKEEQIKTLEEFMPFLDAMYTENDRALFGECAFMMAHWLMYWDRGTGMFLTQRDDEGKLEALAMLIYYREFWHDHPTLIIHRIAMDVEQERAGEIVDGMIEYLVDNASLLRFDYLYYTSRTPEGHELKELVWADRAGLSE